MFAEILAPVGAMPQLIAACRAGADAVYFGSKNFNARRNAENFLDLSEAISYCHARGVKAYITFNTLLLEKEIEDAIEEIKNICLSGADAVILQDLASARIFKKVCPEMPLHASTQMSIHNLSGAKLMKEYGFKRVVLSRELSKAEIKYIHENCNIELEAFVHGAHCMSVSGQCYMSSVIGRRSGNRGLCAQPCRLDWRLNGRNYALSLKDLSLVNEIKELESIGICSLKIEGRMKRPEYVYSSVRECIKARNGEKADTELLKRVFSRSGFTDAYYKNRRNLSMFGIRTDENAKESQQILKEIENQYRNEEQCVAVSFDFSLKHGLPAKLTVFDGENSTTVNGDIPEPATKAPVDEAYITSSLEKCGGTVFFADKIKCDVDGGLFFSKSKLNTMRQEALNTLYEIRQKPEKRTVNNFSYEITKVSENHSQAEKRVFLNNITQYSEELEEFSDEVILYPSDIIKLKDINTNKISVRLPSYLPALAENRLKESLLIIRELGIKKAYIPNLSLLNIAKETGFELCGMYGMNLMNSISVNEVKKLGLSSVQISFESSLKNLKQIKASIPQGIIVYGRLPMMLLHSCPAYNEKGCTNCRKNGVVPVLKDRLGKEFPLLCFDGIYQEIVNSCPLILSDKLDDFSSFAYNDFLFTIENQDECIEVLKSYANKDNIKSGVEFTRGLYYREIM